MTRDYIHFKEPYQFVQGNISSFNDNIFIQGNYIHSRTYIRSSSVKETITEPKDYMTLLNRNVTKSYKKTDHNVPIDIATKDKLLAENLNLTTELMCQCTEIHLSH